MTIFGPCAPYVAVDAMAGLCPSGGLDVGSEEAPGPDRAIASDALLWASRRVFMATGYRFFGDCEATISPPCPSGCGCGRETIEGISEWSPWDGSFWGAWHPVPCGDGLARLPLPFLPARSITEITIDGVVLDPAAYAIDGQAWLVRIDGEPWPSCSEAALSITFRHGLDLPPEGKPLVGFYAVELAKSCQGGECSLAPGIRVVNRDGVDFAVAEPSEYRELLLTGFGPLDDWISLLNGGHVTEPPRIYRPGREHPAPILQDSI